MLRKSIMLYSMGCLLITSFAAFAQTKNTHVVVAPSCLIKNITDYKTLSSGKYLLLIETNDTGIEQLIAAKNTRNELCGGFMDVTQNWKTFRVKNISSDQAKIFLSTYENPSHTLAPRTYHIQYQTQVNTLFKQINAQNMWANLTTFTAFPDRYSQSTTGEQAANWIKTQVETMAQNTGHNDVSVYTIKTGTDYQQPSVVAKVGTSAEPGIVIGSHMDTLYSLFSNKPGADDDGSGTVTVLEAVRTLLSSGMHFKKPIYFIWYAAEEEGLIGSQYVVQEFKKQRIPISEVIQFDLTGYPEQTDPNAMWLMNDYVNPSLTKFLETLINTYIKQSVKYTQCGYACSDHATWTQNGFAAALPAESSFNNTNPNIHSAKDTMDKLSLTHMTDYEKLAVAFAVELAEPVA